MTMQTFVVLFLGVSFGYKIGLASVALYLLEGIVGYQFFQIHLKKVLDFILLGQQWVT